MAMRSFVSIRSGAMRVAALAIATLLASVLVAAPATAATVTATIDGVTYTAETTKPGAGATITGATNPADDLVIPSTVNISGVDYAVTTIGYLAFYYDSLMSVTIPNSVTTIGDSAFGGNSLTSVTIPNSVTTIGDFAFNNNILTSVTIGNSVTTIGDYAFGGNSLTSVTIPNSVTTIGDYAFRSNSLASVTIGNSVSTIGDYAFYENSLTSVTIGNSVTTIGDSAFAHNILTSVTIGNSVTTIGDYAFYENSLTSVTIGNSVTTIGDSAFYSNSLTSVTIGNSVTTIGDSAFSRNFLTSVTIPNSVTMIGDYAFDSNSLTSVTFVGNAPTLSGAYALGEWSTLVKYYQGATGFSNPWHGGGFTDYTTLAIPDPATPEPSGFATGTTRLSGASRYETAIQVSKKYAPGVPAVYVATGTNFPDALSAAAAAAYVGGPLLLTTPTSLPSAVKTEIQRLSPSKIVVIGGTGAVSASVASQLSTIAPVTRYGGADRYATGLQIVNGTFTSSTTAILATGRSFPDALAATGVAGTLNAPVILIDGVKTTLTTATLSTLSSLGVTKVILAGGTGVVSRGIETQLRNNGYTVTRYGGADRYATAALLNNAYFPKGSTETMFLATGTNFPDALAGAAMAGRIGAPLYITTPTCVPTSIRNSINALSPSKKAVLGGTAVVSNNAANNQVCP